LIGSDYLLFLINLLLSLIVFKELLVGFLENVRLLCGLSLGFKELLYNGLGLLIDKQLVFSGGFSHELSKVLLENGYLLLRFGNIFSFLLIFFLVEGLEILLDHLRLLVEVVLRDLFHVLFIGFILNWGLGDLFFIGGSYELLDSLLWGFGGGDLHAYLLGGGLFVLSDFNLLHKLLI
jgi:hypothetical protein